jgi:hypothetical protein
MLANMQPQLQSGAPSYPIPCAASPALSAQERGSINHNTYILCWICVRLIGELDNFVFEAGG